MWRIYPVNSWFLIRQTFGIGETKLLFTGYKGSGCGQLGKPLKCAITTSLNCACFYLICIVNYNFYSCTLFLVVI